MTVARYEFGCQQSRRKHHGPASVTSQPDAHIDTDPLSGPNPPSSFARPSQGYALIGGNRW
jgi:hypothetical protein